MIVKLLTKHHLEYPSLRGGCTGSSESTHVKIPHCWKSHVAAHFSYHLVFEARNRNFFACIARDKDSGQPAHLSSLISAFVIHYLNSTEVKLTPYEPRHVIFNNMIF